MFSRGHITDYMDTMWYLSFPNRGNLDKVTEGLDLAKQQVSNTIY